MARTIIISRCQKQKLDLSAPTYMRLTEDVSYETVHGKKLVAAGDWVASVTYDNKQYVANGPSKAQASNDVFMHLLNVVPEAPAGYDMRGLLRAGVAIAPMLRITEKGIEGCVTFDRGGRYYSKQVATQKCDDVYTVIRNVIKDESSTAPLQALLDA